MGLSKEHKKQIKKKIKSSSPKRVARELNIKPEEIKDYLKRIWRKEKYQRFISSQKKPLFFNLKKWFVKNRLLLFSLGLLVIIVYINAINNDFVSDDIDGILKNPHLDKVKYIFANPFSFFYALIHYLVTQLFGRKPAFFRMFNILSHLGTTLSIYLLISLLFNATTALLSASLFAVHPVLTESVTWISGGYYSYSALLVLLSFSTYILSSHKRKAKFYLLSVFLYFLALCTSEKVIAFPIILFFYEISFRRGKRDWKRIIPFFTLSVIWGFYLMRSFSGRTTALEESYYQERPQTESYSQLPTNFLRLASIAVTSYLGLIFWPKNLTLYHSEMSFALIEYLIRLGFFFLFLAAIVYAFKKNRHIFFWLSFFIISLLPTLTPFGVSWIVAERYVYLGAIGIFVVVSMGFKKLMERESLKPWVIGFFILIILALSARTIRRNMDWQNQDTLWLATARTSPSSHQNHNNLGDLYGRRGDLEKAVEEFKKAIELKPNYGDAYHNLANTYHQMERTNLAIENYQKAIEFNPNLWQSHQNLAGIYFEQGQFDLAREELEKAVSVNPQNANLHLNLGIVYLKLEKKEEAEREFQETLQIDPQNQTARQIMLSI